MFRNLRIGWKMGITLGVAGGLLVIALGIALAGMQQIGGRFRVFIDRDQALLQAVNEMYAQGLQIGQALRNITLDPANQTAYKNLDQAGKDFGELNTRAIKLAEGDEVASGVLKEIATLRAQQVKIQAQIVVQAKDFTAAVAIINKQETPLWRQMKAKMLDLLKRQNAAVAAKKGETLAFTQTILTVSLGLGVVAVLLGLGIAYWLVRGITKPISQAVGVANRLAQGDLSAQAEVHSQDETGQLLHALQEMQDTIRRIVGDIERIVGAAAQGDFSKKIDTASHQGYARTLGELLNRLSATTSVGLNDVMRVAGALSQGDLTQKISREYPGIFGDMKNAVNATVDNLTILVQQIKGAVESIDTAAKEIAAGNQDLSQRTEEQAASLEETASSMEELTSTVKQNADNARQANQLAAGASDVAGKGGQVVSQVVDTMSAITDSSKKIADIITVIDGIAFQTNILALNAAVEAARAGEQGRGFAVVAGEVRNLAQRSATAAKEIKALIGDSVEKVETGSKLVGQAGQTMDEIVTSIKRVTDLMAEISAASSEQSTGIEQVNQAITQMDQVTQQNAALVEEASAASEAMVEQASGLSVSVGRFRLPAEAADRMAMVGGKGGAVVSKASTRPSVRPAVKEPATAKASEEAEEWHEF